MESWLDHEGIEYKVTHGRSGTQLNVKECPVCGSGSWKVYLNAETGLGSCFAGDHPPGENYNKLKFVRAHLGTDNRGALQAVESFVQGSIWRPKPERSVVETVAPTAEGLPESLPIPIEGRNLKYLSDRGITVKTAEHFGIRYCHSGRYNYMWQGKASWQDYSGRVLIPIHDMSGEMVGFQGRDITGTKDKKYLFPPMMASTGRLLYNGHRAKGAARVVVGEGVFDVFAIHQAVEGDASLGDMVAVGTFGKHLSDATDCEDQMAQFLELRRQGLKEVVMMWDSEPSAILAAMSAAQMLRSIGLTPRIAILPDGCDPNEVEPQVVRDAILNAKPLSPAEIVRLRMWCLKDTA